MWKKKLLGVVAALVALSLVATACSSKPKEQPQEAATKAFYGGWPYELPPKTHFNIFGAGNLGMAGSPYNELMMNPLAMYYWATDEWEPLLATDWRVDEATSTITVNLRKGVKWSDGTDFKAIDLLSTLSIKKAQNDMVWRYIDKAVAEDDTTVEFHMKTPSPLALWYLLKVQPQPSSVYGEYAEKIQDLFDQGKDAKSDEVKAAVMELEHFEPKDWVVSGPYKLDVDSMTEAQLTLKKVSTAWNAESVKFDSIIIYNGETAAVTPLVLDKKMDFAAHAFTPATEKQIVAKKIRVVRCPLYTGPALFFNHNLYPLNVTEFRQALAYIINRDEAGTAALDKSAVGVKNMTGFSDNLVDRWLLPSVADQLNKYEQNPARAEDLLRGLNFTKGTDGIWLDEKGKQLSFEVQVPTDYPDWSDAAENIVQQLNKFGIKATLRGVLSTQATQDINAGKFQISLRPYGAEVPHPSAAYVADLITYNGGGATGDKAKPGQSFPLTQEWSGGTIDFDELITESGASMDPVKQKESISLMARAFNELLPVIPIYERYSINPALEGVRVTGWPKDDDPILKNSGADSFVTMMLLTGKLAPK